MSHWQVWKLHIFSYSKIRKILWDIFMTIFVKLKLVSTDMKNAKYFSNWVILKIWKLYTRFVSVGSWKSHCFKACHSVCLILSKGHTQVNVRQTHLNFKNTRFFKFILIKGNRKIGFKQTHYLRKYFVSNPFYSKVPFSLLEQKDFELRNAFCFLVSLMFLSKFSMGYHNDLMHKMGLNVISRIMIKRNN